MAERMAELLQLSTRMRKTVEAMVESPLQLIHMLRTNDLMMAMGEEDMVYLLRVLDEEVQEELGPAEAMALLKTPTFQDKAVDTVLLNKIPMVLMPALLVVLLADMVDLSQIASIRTTQIIHKDPFPRSLKDNTLMIPHVL
jgi:hypothetical protein